MNLHDPCRVCGEIWGTHPARSHDNVCFWIMEAAQCSYDGAEMRYHDGRWTPSQWEAFTIGHPYIIDRYPLQQGYFESFNDVADLFIRLVDHLSAIGRSPHDSRVWSRYNRAKMALGQMAYGERTPR